MTGALAGVRVLELSRYIAAPVAGRALGELGADVVKIEEPSRGDPMRYWQSGDRAHSPQFAAYNRAKRGLALDLKHPDGRDVFLRLVDSADVVVENFRPGVMDRLGLGWDELRRRNPRLVYAAITGFGPTGPYAKRPAYDTVISAMGGLFGMVMDLEAPQPVGPAFSDILSGTMAAQGVLAALYARERTGRGQFVDAVMLRAVLGFLSEPGTVFLDTGENTASTTRQRRAQSYGLVSADGVPFVVHMSVPEKFWIALTDAIDRPELRDDPRFVDRQARHDNYHHLAAILDEVGRTRTMDEWFAVLEAADLPHGRINTMETVFDDPQVQALDVVEEVDMGDGVRTFRQVGPPFHMSDTPLDAALAAPRLGEHSREVLAESGFGDDEVSSLLDDGVIGEP